MSNTTKIYIVRKVCRRSGLTVVKLQILRQPLDATPDAFIFFKAKPLKAPEHVPCQTRIHLGGSMEIMRVLGVSGGGEEQTIEQTTDEQANDEMMKPFVIRLLAARLFVI